MSLSAIPAQARYVLANATKRSSRQFKDGAHWPKRPRGGAYACGEPGVKYSLKSRSITNWVSTSVRIPARIKIEPRRDSCARDVSRVSSVVIDGSGKCRRIEA